MIPSNNNILTTELEVKTHPSKTYKMHMNHNTINGHCDGIEAMIQTVYKILNTERYQHVIYSWNYGFEYQDLLGKPVDYACSELRRRVEEALLQDDRIISVTDFKFDISTKRTVNMTFTVHTIYGDIESERKVNI
jgi:hypothetical protein